MSSVMRYFIRYSTAMSNSTTLNKAIRELKITLIIVGVVVVIAVIIWLVLRSAAKDVEDDY